MKRIKGFTLIELLAVIVVLAIIALIATPLVLNLIENAKKGAAEQSATAYVQATENYIMQHKINPEKYELELEENKKHYIYEGHEIESEEDEEVEASETYIEDEIKVDGTTPQDGYVVIGEKGSVRRAYLQISGYLVECEGTICKVVGKSGSEVKITNDSILYQVKKSSFNESTTSITSNGITYNVHSYVYEGNQVWDSDQVFGDESDVGTETDYAKNMVIVKVKGDLTINSGVEVRPYYTEYGGPKGFLIYVTGTLTNNGTIDNSHGAYAEGENVYLWRNSDESYEFVPASGASGGESVTGNINTPGNSGEDGSNRQTGGGGSGALLMRNSGTGTKTSGAGSTGTSYSGGSGGAGHFGNEVGTVESAHANGGSGSSATLNEGAVGYQMGGGAGNPGGKGKAGKVYNSTYDGENGTGGLLVIYAQSINNTGSIKANGSNGGSTSGVGGAGSGGGSINIFYKNNYTSLGNISSAGGNYGSNRSDLAYFSGKGGTGSITIGSISSGSFVSN